MRVNIRILGGLLSVVVSVASAQETRRIAVTPYAGVLVPSSKLAQIRADVGGDVTALGMEQQTALTTGITAAFSFNNLAGIELSGAWAFSDVKSSSGLVSEIPELWTRPQSARVLFGAAKLMVNLLPINRRAALRLGVGPAVIARGGSAYKANDNGEFDGLTDVGGTVSLCTRFPLTEFLAVRVRAENFMYSSRLRYRSFANPTDTYVFDSRLQNDMIFSAGLQMVWWR